MSAPTAWLVTGAAGFIGMHVCERLLARGDAVLGLDNLNDYYDVALKQARLARLQAHPGFRFSATDITHASDLAAQFASAAPRGVIHLAAQVGVRYSLVNPRAYIDTNLSGFANVLEACREHGVAHLVYASSSSVYGGNTTLPFSEHHNVDHPVSLYAATKKANELMAHTYSHLHGLPTTGLRFFTVYGPWGRPDMALFRFTRAMLAGQPIDIYNHGHMARDFTYIDDIVESLLRVADRPATASATFDARHPDPATSSAPYRVFNIGNSQPTPLMDYVSALEQALGVTAVKNFLPLQPGDMPATAANTAELEQWTGFRPRTAVADGVQRFADWYLGHYGLS
jgi:UDP-glucuronate 4-epimerase